MQQTVLELFKQLPALLQVLIVFSGFIATGCSTMATALATLPKTDGAISWLNRAGHDVSFFTNWLAKLRQKVLAAFLASIMLLTACGASLHSQIEKVIVYEQQVHTYQLQLTRVADVAIAMLPPEKQAQAQALLADANGKLTLALDAKDVSLQAALDASDPSKLNVSQLVADIVAAVNAFVSVVNSFGADQAHTAAIGQRLVAASVAVQK